MQKVLHFLILSGNLQMPQIFECQGDGRNVCMKNIKTHPFMNLMFLPGYELLFDNNLYKKVISECLDSELR